VAFLENGRGGEEETVVGHAVGRNEPETKRDVQAIGQHIIIKFFVNERLKSLSESVVFLLVRHKP
jgi:hypothetical protein